MHDRRRLRATSPATRVLMAFGIALILMVSATITTRASDEYNGNPTYCHSHSEIDFLWWWFSCWLPDPPGEPY